MMISKKKIIIISVLAIAAAGSFYGWKEYNRPLAATVDLRTDATVTSAELLSAYEKDEAVANQKFLGKTIVVSGTVGAIDESADTLTTIILGASEELHHVSCQLEEGSRLAAKKYKVNDTVRLKGICTGYLLDVEMNRCSIQK